MKILNKISTNNINFINLINKFIERSKEINNLEKKVKNIIYNIKKFKEKAIIYYSNKFNKNKFKRIKDLFIDKNLLKNAYLNIDNNLKYAIEICKNKIENFHYNQIDNLINNNLISCYDKNSIMNIKNKINNIGIYIPGGYAKYPSSVLMNCITPKLMNIENIFITSPVKNLNSITLACIYMLGYEKLINLGGAQAIAALAYGFEGINKCDKIYGPGNIYVVLAKKLLYSEVGIDMIAGPSEIIINSNENKNEDELIYDFFSQCEHDCFSQSIIMSKNLNFNVIEKKLIKFLPFNYKKNIIFESLKNKSFFIKYNNYKEAINLINYLSPEHLILKKNDNFLVKYLKNFGSLFLNNYSSESLGDYISGVNHVLPTNQNSKFSSNLNLNDYIKSSSILNSNKINFNKLSNITSYISLNENLQCHSENMFLRKNEKNLWNF